MLTLLFRFFAAGLSVLCLGINVCVAETTNDVWAARAVFSTPSEFDTGFHPFAVKTVDLNHDNQLDLVAINYDFAGSFHVLLGSGNGSFQPATNYVTDNLPQAICIDDFDGDGNLDLITGGVNSNRFQFFAGTGDGSFSPPESFPIESGAYAFASGDFNRDGRKDIVAACFATHTLTLLLGDTNQLFTFGTNLVTGFNPVALAVADFNADGNLDLVNANFYESSISVFLGNGNGTFLPRVDYIVGTDRFPNVGQDYARPNFVVSGDFNGDGIVDLAVANSQCFTVSVLIGKGDGTFAPAVDYPVGASPSWIAVADFNGDGSADIVTADAEQYSLSALTGLGDGTFNPAYAIPLIVTNSSISYPFSVEAGDFNKDGRPDLVVATHDRNTASVLLNLSKPHLSAKRSRFGITLSWPAWSGFELESKSSLATGSWSPVDQTATKQNDRMLLNLRTSTNVQVFRLKGQ